MECMLLVVYYLIISQKDVVQNLLQEKLQWELKIFF